jgi:hypothetical protein
MKRALTIAGSLLAGFAADAAGLNRQDLEKKLQDLAKAPPPTKLAPGAMCYATAVKPRLNEYVCPKCGEKTMYSWVGQNHDKWETLHALQSVDSYRRLVKQLQDKGLDCQLDESAFCQKCGKDANEKAFVLAIRWPERKEPARTTLRHLEDMELLLEFLEGKDRHGAGAGGEKPLKDYLPRIRELLGLDAAKPEEKKTP